MKYTSMDFTRQAGLISTALLTKSKITLIGAGAIGSFTALTLSKMGVGEITVYDEDGVTPHNLPNQFFAKTDVDKFKVEALSEMLKSFSDVKVNTVNQNYVKQKLSQTVIVATDSMSSRMKVWEQFLLQDSCLNYIEARMGAEMGRVYTIRKNKNGTINSKDIHFYSETLYSDDKVKPLPCTERAIIYNILMIASYISRAYKSIIVGSNFPREVLFDISEVNERSFMVRN